MAGNPAVDDEEGTDREETELDSFNTDILDASDDELAAMTNEQIAELSMKDGARQDAEPQTESKSDAANEDDDLETPPITSDTDGDGDEDEDENGKPEDKTEDEDPAEKEGVLKPDAEAEKNSAAKTGDDDESESGDKDKAKKADPVAIDYKQEHEKLLAPFKANGKQIQVDNVDDAITLMKMGANYNKKMAALKPTLKVVKMLEKHDLLDESKLSHLIDVAAHNPAAITKLLKDAKLDPRDIDTEESDEYKAPDHSVNDSQFELDQIIDNIKDNESFPKTIDTIQNQWDPASKKLILEDPRIITVIDEHIQSGIFDQIVSVMEKERLLGRMTDIPDLVAYRQIGEHLNQQGAFGKKAPVDTQTADDDDPEAIAAAKKRDERRLAAASTKTTKKDKIPADFDPLSMPDEEFEKLSVNGLYR